MEVFIALYLTGHYMVVFLYENLKLVRGLVIFLPLSATPITSFPSLLSHHLPPALSFTRTAAAEASTTTQISRSRTRAVPCRLFWTAIAHLMVSSVAWLWVRRLLQRLALTPCSLWGFLRGESKILKWRWNKRERENGNKTVDKKEEKIGQKQVDA